MLLIAVERTCGMLQSACVQQTLRHTSSTLWLFGCRLMYDLLTHAPIADAAPGILVACNKQDLSGAANESVIRKRLEDEL
jgi:Signal recognition particle receptor beta subunit